ncbi:MAG: hypothetical protein ACI9DH_001787 [Halioglobus sp.]|jgi:hypothetical protein
MEAEEQLLFPQIELTPGVKNWRDLSEDDALLPAPDPVMTEWLGLEGAMESLVVLSMASAQSRASSVEHARETLDECREIVSDGLLLWPFKCAVYTVCQCGSWLWDHVEICRDTFEDMGTVRGRFRTEMRVLKSPE